MAAPTISSRLQRRFIVMSSDQKLISQLHEELPGGWALTTTLNLDDLGGFQDILQYRFILLDLDATGVFDPLDVIRQVRMELMLNIAIICFGGASDMRDEARLARADRFFERAEIVEKMKLFCGQYGWGGE